MVPNVAPDDFRAAFTTAEGWGTFSQKRDGAAQRSTIALKYGRLRLRTLVLQAPGQGAPKQVTVTVAGKATPAKATLADGRVQLALASDVTLAAGQTLDVVIR